MAVHPHIAHEAAREALAKDFSLIAQQNIGRDLREKRVTAAIEAQVAKWGEKIVAGALASLDRQMTAKIRNGS